MAFSFYAMAATVNRASQHTVERAHARSSLLAAGDALSPHRLRKEEMGVRASGADPGQLLSPEKLSSPASHSFVTTTVEMSQESTEPGPALLSVGYSRWKVQPSVIS